MIKAGQVSGKISTLVERFGVAALSLGIGLALTVLLALFGYSKLRKKFRRGDVICFCLIPLAVGLTVGACFPVCRIQRTPRRWKKSASRRKHAGTYADATPEPTPSPPEATEAPVETLPSIPERTTIA